MNSNHQCSKRLGLSDQQDTDSTEQCRWADKLRRALEAAYIDLGDFMLDNISPGQPDDRVGETLDDEYWRWLPPRERRQSVPPRQALQGVSDRPRVKYRAQYAWVQREYGKNRSRCAQNVISDA